MAEYHRFISYIYLYERGVKTMNTGFAKVESRNSQCLISVSMKNMYHESHAKFSVYMFVRKDGRLQGILLGELSTAQSCGEFSCVTDPDNIQSSGYTLEDVKGMIIRGDNGKIYGTGWDDEVLNVERFVPMEELREQPAPDGSVPPLYGDNPAAEEGAPEKGEPSVYEGLLAAEEAAPREDGEPPVYEDLSAAEEAAPQEDGEPPVYEDLSAAEEAAPQEEAVPEESGKQPPEQAFPDGPETRQPVLETIIDQGMRMYPFEDDEIRACVRLEPQDIGRLPLQYWRLAGNSFLLHGYYSYRHLIMAQKNDGTYILGIPGINYERENFMAQMFGFHKFKPVRAHARAGGEFGYWYTELICTPAGEMAGA